MSGWRLFRTVCVLSLTLGSAAPALADNCTILSTRWVATAAGRVNNGFPILYVGFSSNYSPQIAAHCAGVVPSQVQFQGGGPWGVICGQTFTKCN